MSTQLSNIPLLSIRTAGRIGLVLEPIINPHNLHIDGFFCRMPRSQQPLILLDMFIREISLSGIIINEHGNLSEPEELVRLQPILKLQFKLVGKTVLCGKKKLGKVSEYAMDSNGLFIQKIYVQPPVWQSLNQSQLTIGRSSILEVTNTHIKVSEPVVKAETKKAVASPIFATDYSANASLIEE